MMTLDICVCTFQRDSVVTTIASLMKCAMPDDVEVGITIIDNDDGPSARQRVLAAAKLGDYPVRYLHRAGRNISIARNAALDASRARFVAFIDDDAVAAPDWILALWHHQKRTGAEIVIGPVLSVYDENAPTWMQTADVHSVGPVWEDDEIRTGYTCNVLIDRESQAIRDLRFDVALGRSGGEDTDYFGAVHAGGGRISFAADAIVEEPVTPARLAFSWLALRRYRMGQTHAHVLINRQGQNRLKAMPVAAAKLGYCLLVAILTLPSRRLRNTSILRGCLHAGVLAGLSGQATVSIYGKTDLNSRPNT